MRKDLYRTAAKMCAWGKFVELGKGGTVVPHVILERKKVFKICFFTYYLNLDLLGHKKATGIWVKTA